MKKRLMVAGLGSRSRSEPGVLGSLEPEPEPLEKKTRRTKGKHTKKVFFLVVEPLRVGGGGVGVFEP